MSELSIAIFAAIMMMFLVLQPKAADYQKHAIIHITKSLQSFSRDLFSKGSLSLPKKWNRITDIRFKGTERLITAISNNLKEIRIGFLIYRLVTTWFLALGVAFAALLMLLIMKLSSMTTFWSTVALNVAVVLILTLMGIYIVILVIVGKRFGGLHIYKWSI